MVTGNGNYCFPNAVFVKLNSFQKNNVSGTVEYQRLYNDFIFSSSKIYKPVASLKSIMGLE